MLCVKALLVLLAIILISASALAPSQSLAIHKSEKTAWQVVFLSSNKACSNYHYQIMNKYDSIAEKYFELYQFENSKHPPTCMSESKYSTYQIPGDLDLLILIYDKNIGRKELQANDIGGLYTHVGDDRTKNHTIVLCDCPNFKFSDPVWILTHEMSHFILFHLGFDSSIVETNIHALDAKYDHCIEQHDKIPCTGVQTKIRGDFQAYDWTVMPPYLPAVGKKFIPETTNHTSISPYLVPMQKEITKWWLDGKISDAEYAKSLVYLVDAQKESLVLGNVSSSFDTPSVIFADGPNDMETNGTLYDVHSKWDEKKTSTLLGRVPFKTDSDSDKILRDGNDIQIPQWFKSRAQWWADEKLWTDEEFLSGAKYLFSRGIIIKEN